MRLVQIFSEVTAGSPALLGEYLETRSQYSLSARGPAVSIAVEWSLAPCPAVKEYYKVSLCRKTSEQCSLVFVVYPNNKTTFHTINQKPIEFFNTYTAEIDYECEQKTTRWSRQDIPTGAGGESRPSLSHSVTLMSFRIPSQQFCFRPRHGIR